MDFNEYAALMMVRERHAEMVAAARRDALVRQSPRRHRTVRAALGTTLIRVGAWLLREHSFGGGLGGPLRALPPE